MEVVASDLLLHRRMEMLHSVCNKAYCLPTKAVILLVRQVMLRSIVCNSDSRMHNAKWSH